MAVAAHQDAHLRPVPADAPDDMFEDGADLVARRRLAGAQDHRHRLAARPLVDVDRQKAALVVVGVEQRKLLVAMHRIERVVDVEHDRAGLAAVAVAELIHHRRHQPGKLDLRRRVLQPRHRRLRAQRLAALGQPPHRHLEHRIVPQRIAVVGVLVTRSDREHPKPQHLLNVCSMRSGSRHVLGCIRQSAPPSPAASRCCAATARPRPTTAARHRTLCSTSCGKPMEDRTAVRYLRS